MTQVQRLDIHHGADLPAAWGLPRLAQRQSTIAIREPLGEESFDLPWGRLTAVPGVDVVAVQDSGECYPIKKDIFPLTYTEVSPGRYRKSALSRLVAVPPGCVAVLHTLEGVVEVAHPDFVAIGPKDEVYANARAWVDANLVFVTSP